MTLKLDFAQVESVIDTIIDEARTGEIGDGKIFGNVNFSGFGLPVSIFSVACPFNEPSLSKCYIQ
jgi:hypothetical protein